MLYGFVVIYRFVARCYRMPLTLVCISVISLDVLSLGVVSCDWQTQSATTSMWYLRSFLLKSNQIHEKSFHFLATKYNPVSTWIVVVNDFIAKKLFEKDDLDIISIDWPSWTPGLTLAGVLSEVWRKQLQVGRMAASIINACIILWNVFFLCGYWLVVCIATGVLRIS